MLLIHGFTGTPVMWDPIVPFLEQHHNVVAINLPGHFGGPKIEDPGDHIADTLTTMIEQQMDDLGWERAHIVGNSLGGWAALLLAQRRRALAELQVVVFDEHRPVPLQPLLPAGADGPAAAGFPGFARTPGVE